MVLAGIVARLVIGHGVSLVPFRFVQEAGTAVLPRYEINEVNHIYLIYT